LDSFRKSIWRTQKMSNKNIVSIFALFLMLTMIIPLVALPAVSAQDNWSIFITARSSDWRIRGEVRLNNVRQQTAFTGIMLGVRTPGQADWTYLGPIETLNGQFDHFYAGPWPERGTYMFQYVVPAQGALPANPQSPDGNWYSSVAVIEFEEVMTTPSYAWINAVPNVVGVGQEVLLHTAISHPTAWPFRGWEGLIIDVERPDGTTEELGPFTTDLTGGTGHIYVPTMVGTYRFRTRFPTQTSPVATSGFPSGTTFLASESWWQEVTVTQDPQPHHPGYFLPVEYWTRPISAELREWGQTAGNYLGQVKPQGLAPHSMFQPDSLNAPETGHILWAEPILGGGFSPLGGGVAGGATGHFAFEDGDAYEGMFLPPVVMGGVIYFNRYKADGSTRVEQEVVAVDQRTGEELWVRNWNNTRLSRGVSFFYTGFNYHAVFQYLVTTIGGTANFYEASTGRWAFAFSNLPAGTDMYGPNGEWIRIQVNKNQGWMQKWNMRWVIDGQRWISQGRPDSTFGSWVRQLMGTTLDARVGIEWRVDIPQLPDLPGSIRVVYDGLILGSNYRRGSPTLDTPAHWAFSFDSGHQPGFEPIEWVNTDYGTVPRRVHDSNVRLLFNREWTPPAENAILHPEAISIEEDVFTVVWNDNPTTYGFSLSTGEKLWEFGPYHYQTNWSYESLNSWDLIWDGKALIGGHGGTLHAVNVQTGESLWNFTITDPYNEYLFNTAWRFRIATIADGKAYLEHTEHSPFDPQPRGAALIAVDLETGEEVWRLAIRGTEWGSQPVIADDILVAYNTYDQRVYAVGKGPSQTTVAASPKISSFGSMVLVEGTVMDISAGTQSHGVSSRFPHGVPAIADEDMTAWMHYVYMQYPRPNVEGVEVVISVVDANDNYYEVGRTTSSANGVFKLEFEPPITGGYSVIASFDGSKSYWPSHAETSITVHDAPAATDPPQFFTDFNGLFAATAAIIVAIAIVGALILLKLRKRP
jgi:outer membrane protein assembly factor BamB